MMIFANSPQHRHVPRKLQHGAIDIAHGSVVNENGGVDGLAVYLSVPAETGLVGQEVVAFENEATPTVIIAESVDLIHRPAAEYSEAVVGTVSVRAEDVRDVERFVFDHLHSNHRGIQAARRIGADDRIYGSGHGGGADAGAEWIQTQQ